MFTDMATANPVIFVNHVSSLKNLAERQPVYVHQVVPIIGAVGTVNQVRILILAGEQIGCILEPHHQQTCVFPYL